MIKLFGTSVLTLCLLVGTAFSDETNAKAKTTATPATTNKADGIELPADTKVGYDEGFVPIQADCKGPVKFIVVVNQGVKVKSTVNDATNTIIVSIPPQGGVISVYAVGLVDSKLTDPVLTTITVAAPAGTPSPSPPNSTTLAGPLNITFVLNLNQATPAIAKVLNSEKLRKTITDAGNFFRIYDKADPAVAKAGMDKVLLQSGGTSVMIIQRSDGSLATIPVAIPNTEAEVLAKIKEAGGMK